jgi:hypothetical protein
LFDVKSLAPKLLKENRLAGLKQCPSGAVRGVEPTVPFLREYTLQQQRDNGAPQGQHPMGEKHDQLFQLSFTASRS